MFVRHKGCIMDVFLAYVNTNIKYVALQLLFVWYMMVVLDADYRQQVIFILRKSCIFCSWQSFGLKEIGASGILSLPREVSPCFVVKFATERVADEFRRICALEK